MYKIFLDDIRNPSTVYPNDNEWVIVRNIDDFKKIIIERGAPNEISFDHDLGEREDKSPIEASEALTWLMYADYIVPKIRIHSDNNSGSLNLEAKAKTWHKVLKMDGLLPDDNYVIRVSALQLKSLNKK